MSTYGELDKTAAESQQALRSLAHETVRIPEVGEMYWLLGRLNGIVRSLQQVLYQVANAHQDHVDHAVAGPDGNAAEGRASAIDGCRQVRRAADLLEGAQTFLDNGQRASGRIAWRSRAVPVDVGQEPQPEPGTSADVATDHPGATGGMGNGPGSRRVRQPARPTPARNEGPGL